MKNSLHVASEKASQLPRSNQPGQITVGGYYIEALDRLKLLRKKSRVTPLPPEEETPNPDLIRKQTPKETPTPDDQGPTPQEDNKPLTTETPMFAPKDGQNFDAFITPSTEREGQTMRSDHSVEEIVFVRPRRLQPLTATINYEPRLFLEE